MEFTESEMKILKNAQKMQRNLKIAVPVITLILLLYIIGNVWAVLKVAHESNLSFGDVLTLGKSPVSGKIYHTHEVMIVSRMRGAMSAIYSLIFVAMMVWLAKVYGVLIKCKTNGVRP